MLEDHDVSFPTLWDPAGDIAPAMGGLVLPYSVAFDRDGGVAARVFGEVTEADLERLLERIAADVPDHP